MPSAKYPAYVIRNTTAYLGSDFTKTDGIDIAIARGSIAAIGKRLAVRRATEIDGSSFFVTPGFINSHFHPSQQINRGIGCGMNHDEMMDLLHATDRIKKSSDKYWLSYLAVLEGLKTGTTCFYSVGSDISQQIRVYNTLMVRAACVLISKDIVAREKSTHVRARVWGTEDRLKEAERLHRRYHNDLVRVHFGAVNVRYCSDRLLRGMYGLAEKYDTYFHMHAAESVEYVEKVRQRTGHTPIAHLAALGMLSPRTSLAHATQLTSRDIRRLAAAGAHVVHCPRANSYLAVGVCPLLKLLSAGVNVALGSDAAINNNSNEVRGEARAAYDRIADSSGQADLIDHLTLFRMLTINGAKAMGLAERIGTIEEGKRADVVLWSKEDLPFIPGLNYLADLLFTDSCRAHTVFIDGRLIVRGYRLLTADEGRLKRKALQISKKYRDLVARLEKKHAVRNIALRRRQP